MATILTHCITEGGGSFGGTKAISETPQGHSYFVFEKAGEVGRIFSVLIYRVCVVDFLHLQIDHYSMRFSIIALIYSMLCLNGTFISWI